MLAQLTTIIAQAHGDKNADIYDFAPSVERPPREFSEILAEKLGKK